MLMPPTGLISSVSWPVEPCRPQPLAVERFCGIALECHGCKTGCKRRGVHARENPGMLSFGALRPVADRPASIDETLALLKSTGYVANRPLATVLFLALKLGR